MADDIRVRLSAEGVTDIIAAFNKVRDSAKESGGAISEAFSEAGKNLLGFLGVGEVLNSIHTLFAEITQGAVSLDKLHQTTGLSTDALQALNAAAKENLVPQEALDKGLQMMSRTLGQAEQGSSKAQQALGNLGISMKDLQGLNADQQFQLIAQHLAEIPDPAKRAADGAAIFGRNFAQIEPVILEVAQKGFGPFLDKLKELGVYLSGDMIAQMKALQQQMNEVGEEAKGMATQFLTGFVPALGQAMDALVKATNTDGASGFKSFGETVGNVFKTIVEYVIDAGKEIAGLGVGIGIVMSGIKTATADLVHGNLQQAKKDLAEMRSELNAAGAALKEDEASVHATLWTAPKPPPATPGAKSDGTGESTDTDQVNAARLALIQARLQAELALFNAQSKLKLDAEKQSYDEGLITLDKYYADRQAIIQAQYAKEIEILQQRRASVAAQPVKPGDQAGALEQQAQLTSLDGQIAAKREEQHAAVMANTAEETQARQKMQESELAADEKLLELEGKKADAQRLQLGLEAQQLAQSLQRGGVPQDQVNSAVGGYVQGGLNQIDFSESRTDADAAFTDLQTKIAAIKSQVANGQLFPVQGEQQMQQAIQAALPALQQYAQAMENLARTPTAEFPTGNPQLIAQADQFQQKIQQLATQTNEYGQALARLKQTAQDAFISSVSNGLDKVLSGTERVGPAFRSMGEQFAQAILKMETQFLASQFLKWLTGTGPGGTTGTSGGTSSLSTFSGLISNLFGGSGSGGASAGVGAVSQATTETANTTAIVASTTAMTALITAITANTAAVAASATSETGSDAEGLASDVALYAADGGHLDGPSHAAGGIMVEAEGGEFIVNKAAVARPGVRSLLEAMNGTPAITPMRGISGLPAYAMGGAVSSGSSGTVIHQHVDASRVDKHVVQAAVDKAVMDSIARNPAKVRQHIAT